MQNINISDEIVDKIINRSKQINCNPEKLVNSILYDYLMKVDDIPSTIDREKILSMLEHDNPQGDDTLERLKNLGNVGWD